MDRGKQRRRRRKTVSDSLFATSFLLSALARSVVEERGWSSCSAGSV